MQTEKSIVENVTLQIKFQIEFDSLWTLRIAHPENVGIGKVCNR